MSRWAPDAALRLEQAAMELFAEQGYAATTVPEITERAGLTTRTFFRHFADKREVLFLREREFPVVVRQLLADAPPTMSPLDLVMFGFETVAARDFGAWRGAMVRRREVLRSDDGLRERELLKSSMLADAIAQGLTDRGVPAAEAVLVARAGVVLFDLALDDWLTSTADDPSRSLVSLLRERQALLAQACASASAVS